MDYHWKVSFVLNDAKCQNDFTYYNWVVKQLPVKRGKSRVQFSFVFTRRRYDDYWHIHALAEKKVYKILDTMSPGLFYNLGYPFFPMVSDLELILENIQQLKAAGQQIPSHGSLWFKYNLSLSKVGFKSALRRNSRINKSANRRILRHFLLLYRRGLSCEDDFDKFFTLWRSFNALYNHFCKGKYESPKICRILKKLDPRDITYLVGTYSKVSRSSEIGLLLVKHGYNLFKYLANRKLVDSRNRNRSQQLRKAISSGRQEDILEKAMLCLYVVRCNFAHGSDSQIIKDRNLFRICSTFLAALLMCLESKLV